MVTEKPLACSNLPKEAAMMPLPREEVTPPVMKMYLVDEPIRMEKDDFDWNLMGLKIREISRLSLGWRI